MSIRQIIAYPSTLAVVAVLAANPTDYGLADRIERELSRADREAIPATAEPFDAGDIDRLAGGNGPARASSVINQFGQHEEHAE